MLPSSSNIGDSSKSHLTYTIAAIWLSALALLLIAYAYCPPEAAACLLPIVIGNGIYPISSGCLPASLNWFTHHEPSTIVAISPSLILFLDDSQSLDAGSSSTSFCLTASYNV